MKISKRLKFLLLSFILPTPIIVSSILASSQNDFILQHTYQTNSSTLNLPPVGKPVDESILNGITNPRQYFYNISNKFSYDFVDEAFKSDVINELQELIKAHKETFLENSSNIIINGFDNPKISAESPSTLKFQSGLTYNSNQSTSITITIKGFCVESTQIKQFPNGFSVSSYSELSKLIPKEIVEEPAKKQILTEFLQKNIDKFFDYVPKKARVNDIIPTLDSANDRALDLIIKLEYYSDQGYLTPKPLAFDKIKLIDFSKPQLPTTAKTITVNDLYNATGLTSTWRNLERKYVNDFVIDGELKTKALSEIEKVINNINNKAIFFDNPIPSSQSQKPIVENGTLEFKKDDQDLGILIISGRFLSINENPNNTEFPYKQMEIKISGFRNKVGTVKKETAIDISKHPVLGKILAGDAQLYIDDIKEVLKQSLVTDQNNNSKIFEYQSYYTKLAESNSDIRVAVVENRVELSNVRILGVYGEPPSTLLTKSYDQITLEGFQRPEQNNTTAKAISVAQLVSNSQEFSVLNNIWVDEILQNIKNLQSTVNSLFVKFINSNPEWFFTNHVDPTKQLPYIQEGTLINFEKAKDEVGKYTKLLIKGSFLTKPANPNDNPIYKEHTIEVTGFKNSVTGPNPDGFAIDDTLKDITLADIKEKPENVEKIKVYLEKNFGNVLFNIINGYTTFRIAYDNQGMPLITPNQDDPSQALITIEVNNYITHDCSINNQAPRQFVVYLNGFAVRNDSQTTAKNVDASTIARNENTGEFAFLKELDKKFALDIVTSNGFKGDPGIKSDIFIDELTKLINKAPRLFFYEPAEDSSEIKPYVKPGEKLSATLAKDGEYDSIVVSGYFLKKPLIQGAESSYSPTKMEITINGLNINPTKPNDKPVSIKGFTFNQPQSTSPNPIVPSEMTINQFLQLSNYSNVLLKFINDNFFSIFDNVSYNTTIDQNSPLYSTPKQDIQDPTVLNVSVQVIHYATTNGYINVQARAKNFEIKIKGFKEPPLTPADKETIPRQDITSYTLANEIDKIQDPNAIFKKYSILANLSMYQAWEYTTKEGLKNSSFVNEFRLSIKENPELWFNNVVDVNDESINPLKLPFLKENEQIEVGIEKPTETEIEPYITITSTFLTQPERIGVVVTEKDYKKLTIKIRNSPEKDFWNRKSTTINNDNIDTEIPDDEGISTFNINGSWVSTNGTNNEAAALSALRNFDLEAFASNNIDLNVKRSLFDNIRKILNSSIQKVLKNIVVNTEITEIYESDVLTDGWIDIKNNRIIISITVVNTIDNSGQIQTKPNTNFAPIAVSGFGSNVNKNVSNVNKNFDIIIIVLSTISASIIIIFTFLFIRLYRQRKDLRLNDKQWEDFK